MKMHPFPVCTVNSTQNACLRLLIYQHANARIRTHTNAYAHTCTQTQTYEYDRNHTHANAYARISMHTQAHACIRMLKYAYPSIHMQSHARQRVSPFVPRAHPKQTRKRRILPKKPSIPARVWPIAHVLAWRKEVPLDNYPKHDNVSAEEKWLKATQHSDKEATRYSKVRTKNLACARTLQFRR
jgi:hypothetical protein